MQFTRREVHICMEDIFHHLQPYTRIAVQPLLNKQSHGFMYADSGVENRVRRDL